MLKGGPVGCQEGHQSMLVCVPQSHRVLSVCQIKFWVLELFDFVLSLHNSQPWLAASTDVDTEGQLYQCAG